MININVPSVGLYRDSHYIYLINDELSSADVQHTLDNNVDDYEYTLITSVNRKVRNNYKDMNYYRGDLQAKYVYIVVAEDMNLQELSLYMRLTFNGELVYNMRYT